MLYNEMLWVILLLVNFSSVLFLYKIFGKKGLFIWIAIATIVANIQVVVGVNLFGLRATLGNIVYGTSYLATDILNEKYGKDEAMEGVKIGFTSLIIFTAIIYISTNFNIIENSESFRSLFGILPRITFASMTAYILSQSIDVIIFSRLKDRYEELWVRNNISTGFSQFIDSLIFTILAFYGVLPNSIVFQIFLTTYILKFVVAVLDTPFIYAAKRIR